MKLNVYQSTAITTIAATLLLILVGGLVRASGAGLGCPDWPKCYGLWIPPMDVSDVPAGFNTSDFNAVKTWTEYINRLIGVLIGFLIMATFALSFRYRKVKPSVTVASAAAFVLVLFQGWLGGMVVRSGLTEWIISVHMVTAMVIVGLLIFAAFKAISGNLNLKIDEKTGRRFLFWSVVLLVLIMIQMILGTQIREAIDSVSRSGLYPDRNNWLPQVGILDVIHRSFSWSILIVSAYLIWFSSRFKLQRYFFVLNTWIMVMILIQVGVGIVLAYLGMPPAFQVLHLFGSAVLVSAILLLVFSVKEAKEATS